MEQKSKKIVIGKKQTMRAITRGEAEKVYISKDADFYVIKPIEEVCSNLSIEIVYYENMRDLGNSCGIDVNAAAAAVLK
jgi:large subunit ribosomal protein L7A